MTSDEPYRPSAPGVPAENAAAPAPYLPPGTDAAPGVAAQVDGQFGPIHGQPGPVGHPHAGPSYGQPGPVGHPNAGPSYGQPVPPVPPVPPAGTPVPPFGSPGVGYTQPPGLPPAGYGYYGQPAPPYPPPGTPYAAGPAYGPPRPPGHNPGPKRWKRWIALAVVLVLVLLTGLGIAIWLFVRAVTAPNEVVNAYLDDVQAGRYDAAYGRLCPPLRRNSAASDLADYWAAEQEANGSLVNTDIAGSSVETTNGVTERLVTVSLEYSQFEETVVYEVGKTGDAFCLLTY